MKLKIIKLVFFGLIFPIIYLSSFNFIWSDNIQDECNDHSLFLKRKLENEFKSGLYKYDNLLNPSNYQGNILQNFFNDLKLNYYSFNKELFETFDFYSEFDEGNELVYSQFRIFINEEYFYDIIIIFNNSKIIREDIPKTYRQRKSIFKQMMNLTNFCIIQIKVDINGELKELKDLDFKDLYKKLIKKREEIIKLKSKVDKNKKRK